MQILIPIEMKGVALSILALLPSLSYATDGPAPSASSVGAEVFLSHIQHTHTLASTVPDSGDQNPYAVVVAPVTSGKIQKGDVLVDNFNNSSNLQGTGSTIMNYNPTTKTTSLFAQIPAQVDCPGGVGLSAAMTMLKTGWVIVGSAPSKDGTAATRGAGCLIVLDSQGQVQGTFHGENINSPWGNMAVQDRGSTATLFVSNVGFGVSAPQDPPVVVNQATVLRIELSIPEGKPPVITSQTVVAHGFGEQADAGAFLIGPTGLALGENDKLYVADAVGNRIVEISDASKRTTSAGTGEVVTQGELLQRPLALATTANGHLLVTNALNGQVVEVDPVAKKQLLAHWIDTDTGQTPPGNGDLFGLAMNPSGSGFYYVEDDMNTLMEAE